MVKPLPTEMNAAAIATAMHNNMEYIATSSRLVASMSRSQYSGQLKLVAMMKISSGSYVAVPVFSKNQL